jgi:quercetin dioxygenase-like cupin family protein
VQYFHLTFIEEMEFCLGYLNRAARRTGTIQTAGLGRRARLGSAIDGDSFSVEDANLQFHPLRGEIMSELKQVSWSDVEMEKMNDKISRQMISGENATVAQLFLKRGATVPRHSHVNEQYSWIMSGKLKFIFDDRDVVVGAGGFLVIPANMPHSAVAEEDTLDVDIFVPRREDWIRKEDAYLRG